MIPENVVRNKIIFDTKTVTCLFLIILISDSISIHMFLLKFRLESKIYFYFMMKRSNLALSSEKFNTFLN